MGYGCKQIITNHWSSSFSAARLSAHPPCRGDTQTPVPLTPRAFSHHQHDDRGSVTANWPSVTVERRKSISTFKPSVCVIFRDVVMRM